MWKREEVVWAAGLFEGEGTITSQIPRDRKRDRRVWHLRIRMNDEDVIKKFHAFVKLGNVTQTGDGMWCWQTARRAHVYALLAALYSFLGERRRARASEAMGALPSVDSIRWSNAA